MTKIGLDLDGVIIYNAPYWREYFLENEKAHGHSIRGNDLAQISPNWDYLNHICRKCFDACLHQDRFILGYKPTMVASIVVPWLGWSPDLELHLITNRPKDVAEKTKLWVENIFPSVFKTITVCKEKVPVAEELGIQLMVDDGPHNIEAFQAAGKRILIWDAPYNQHLKGERVYNWFEVVDKIKGLQRENSEKQLDETKL
jgi:uncharacterized HAD superfamily protein